MSRIRILLLTLILLALGFSKTASAAPGFCAEPILLIRSCCGGEPKYSVVHACRGLTGPGCDPLANVYWCTPECGLFDAAPSSCEEPGPTVTKGQTASLLPAIKDDFIPGKTGARTSGCNSRFFDWLQTHRTGL